MDSARKRMGSLPRHTATRQEAAVLQLPPEARPPRPAARPDSVPGSRLCPAPAARSSRTAACRTSGNKRRLPGRDGWRNSWSVSFRLLVLTGGWGLLHRPPLTVFLFLFGPLLQPGLDLV